MNTILITGGTGFIGSRLVKYLAAHGHPVRVMVVENDPLLSSLAGIACEIVTGDITRPQSLECPLSGVHTVFHLAAVLYSHDAGLFRKINLEGTKNLVEASVRAGVRHFVYVSAAAAGYRVRTGYGETKHLAEELMRVPRARTSFTVVRPTLVFGPSGGGQELVMYVEQLRRFRWFIPLVGGGKAKKRWVFVDDVIAGLELVVGRTVAFGKVYNLGGADVHTMREYTRMMCKRLNISKPIVPVPIWICQFVAWLLRMVRRSPLLKRDTIMGVTMDADVDIEPARRDLGYQPVAFEDWLFTATAGDPFWDS